MPDEPEGSPGETGSTPEDLPDVPFLTGVGSGNWHAIPKDSLDCCGDGWADSVTFASCGELVRVARKFGAYSRTTTPVLYHPCQICAWTAAAAGGEAALQAEADLLRPTADELPKLARLVPDPFVAVNACRAILARERDEDEAEHGLDHPATIQLLATIAEHVPALLVSEECADGDCEHTGGACPPSAAACLACSLVVGDWAGEWQGQVRPECTIKAPCAVLLALSAAAEAGK
jgi:hypothetical protein